MITRSFAHPETGDDAPLPDGSVRPRVSSPATAEPGARVRGRPTHAWKPRGNKRRGQTVSGNYWSSSTNRNNPDNAWNVNFNNGNDNNDNKTNGNYVRAVRGGS